MLLETWPWPSRATETHEELLAWSTASVVWSCCCIFSFPRRKHNRHLGAVQPARSTSLRRSADTTLNMLNFRSAGHLDSSEQSLVFAGNWVPDGPCLSSRELYHSTAALSPGTPDQLALGNCTQHP